MFLAMNLVTSYTNKNIDDYNFTFNKFPIFLFNSQIDNLFK